MTLGKWMGRSKVYFVGAMVYFNIMNFILLLLTSNKLYEVGFPVWIVVPAGCLIVIVLGIWDYNFVLKHQLKHYNKQNDVKMQLERVERLLVDLKKDLAAASQKNRGKE